MVKRINCHLPFAIYHLTRHAVELDALVAGLVAGKDLDVAAGSFEELGEVGDQGVVGGPVDRRSGQSDHERVTAPPAHGVLRGAGNDPDIEDHWLCHLPFTIYHLTLHLAILLVVLLPDELERVVEGLDR